ncbi:hypothetical protein LWO97_004404 [Salmonella enterica subsp. enterica serovar Enteritidis]|nr:hypothetical protein [Salmonella enterica]EIR2646761.1 hypothetical protein [Salmonella enterica subsp. enterica serovar Enteritidis]
MGLAHACKKEVVEFRHAYAKNKISMVYNIKSDVKKQDALQRLMNLGFRWVIVYRGVIVFKAFYEYQAINQKRLMSYHGAKVMPVNENLLDYLNEI